MLELPPHWEPDRVGEVWRVDYAARFEDATRWREVLPAEAPFDLLFVDGGGQETKGDETVLGLLATGGTLVLDDLTPGLEGPDPVRDLWLSHPRLAAVELQLSAREAAIVASLQAQ